MSNNPYARPRFDRELTAEEEAEIDNIYYYIGDDRYRLGETSDSDSDSEYLPNESVSECDEPGSPEVLVDVEIEELLNSIQNAANDESTIEEEEEIVAAVEANRGQKYVGQGKNNKTIWWSMPTASEIERSNALKAKRNASRAHCKRNFDDKKEAFTQIFTPAIVEEIVIETNRKARRVYEENRQDSSPREMRPWMNTTADEIYAYIAILLYAGAEKKQHGPSNRLMEHFKYAILSCCYVVEAFSAADSLSTIR